ncbi:MAG TPA: hypothetical protein ENK57_16875, partial [Polyangiaceae bacterium]|nr:hypothetical protein [Polyangiaceae bacterium]
MLRRAFARGRLGATFMASMVTWSASSVAQPVDEPVEEPVEEPVAEPPPDPMEDPPEEPPQEPVEPIDEPPAPPAPVAPPVPESPPTPEPTPVAPPAPTSDAPPNEPPAATGAATGASGNESASATNELPPEGHGDEEEGEEDGTAVVGGEYRRLNGHNFITPFNVPSAFLNTSITTQQGFGVIQFEGVDPFTGDSRNSEVFAYAQSLGGQIGIANRVAITVYATGVAALGSAVEEILSIGALANLTAGGGAKVRLFSSDEAGFQLSVGTFIQYDRDFNVRPGAYLAALVGGLPNLPVPPSQDDFQDLLAEAEGQLLAQQEAAEIAPALMLAEG